MQIYIKLGLYEIICNKIRFDGYFFPVKYLVVILEISNFALW